MSQKRNVMDLQILVLELEVRGAQEGDILGHVSRCNEKVDFPVLLSGVLHAVSAYVQHYHSSRCC